MAFLVDGEEKAKLGSFNGEVFLVPPWPPKQLPEAFCEMFNKDDSFRDAISDVARFRDHLGQRMQVDYPTKMGKINERPLPPGDLQTPTIGKNKSNYWDPSTYQEFSKATDVENLIPSEWLGEGGIPLDRVQSVILRTLDLLDRCSYSALVVIGTPECWNELSKDGVAPVPVGNVTRQQVHDRWVNHEAPISPAREGLKYSVFQDLPATGDPHDPRVCLADWEKDGAVIVDPRDGKVWGVTLEIIPDPLAAPGSRGGLRKKTSESLVCEASCITMLKKKKSSDGCWDTKIGWTQVRTSNTAKSAASKSEPVPFQYYYPTGEWVCSSCCGAKPLSTRRGFELSADFMLPPVCEDKECKGVLKFMPDDLQDQRLKPDPFIKVEGVPRVRGS